MDKMLEEILVVPTSELFALWGAWNGICKGDVQQFNACVAKHGTFMPRGLAEENETFKQLIPYVVLRSDEQVFVMQRRETASEQRLKSKKSLGVGGHIRKADCGDCLNVGAIDWALREIHEEVSGCNPLASAIRIAGFINDDANAVGRVHCGVLYELEVPQSQLICIRDEHKSGQFADLQVCHSDLEAFENWSQLYLRM